jgi:hypothetical protein
MTETDEQRTVSMSRSTFYAISDWGRANRGFKVNEDIGGWCVLGAWAMLVWAASEFIDAIYSLCKSSSYDFATPLFILIGAAALYGIRRLCGRVASEWLHKVSAIEEALGLPSNWEGIRGVRIGQLTIIDL